MDVALFRPAVEDRRGEVAGASVDAEGPVGRDRKRRAARQSFGLGDVPEAGEGPGDGGGEDEACKRRNGHGGTPYCTIEAILPEARRVSIRSPFFAAAALRKTLPSASVVSE